MRISSLAAITALSFAAVAAVADTVTLRNGDKITGTINEINPTSIVVTTPYAGKLTIERTAVQTLLSEQTVRISRPDGTTDTKFVTPVATGAGWRETATFETPPSVPRAEKPTRTSRFLYIAPDWQNQLVIGFINRAGNDESTEFVGGLTFHYERKPDEFQLRFEGAYGQSNGAQTAGLFQESVIYRRDITDRLYWFVEQDARYDAVKAISLELNAFAGLGYYLYRTDDLKIDVRGGPGYTYQQLFDDTETSAVAGRAALRFAWAMNERVTITQEFTYTSSLEDVEDFIFRSETAANIKLDTERGLGLKLSFVDDYDNSPSAGKKSNDTRLAVALTLDF